MTARSARTGRTGARPLVQATTKVAVVTCACGLFPLDEAMHRTSGQAWQAAAKHAALNPTKCTPRLFWDLVPAGLAAGLPRSTEPQQAETFAVVA